MHKILGKALENFFFSHLLMHWMNLSINMSDENECIVMIQIYEPHRLKLVQNWKVNTALIEIT